MNAPALSEPLAEAAQDLFRTWQDARRTRKAPPARGALRLPMETQFSATPWQCLPEMKSDLAAELAGVSGAMDLLAIWHIHAARRAAAENDQARRIGMTAAARSAQAVTANRCKLALKAHKTAQGARATLRDLTGGVA